MLDVQGVMQNRMLNSLHLPEKAKKMLVESEFKISEIAEAVGYSDVSYFSKSFKKYFGVSPKAVSG